jgi:hypothetical protein
MQSALRDIIEDEVFIAINLSLNFPTMCDTGKVSDRSKVGFRMCLRGLNLSMGCLSIFES